VKFVVGLLTFGKVYIGPYVSKMWWISSLVKTK